MNCEGPYLAERFLHNLCPCFDIVFELLGVIARTNNKIVEIAGASECYLIINPFKESGIKEAAVPNIPSVKLADGKMSMKKEKNSSYLIYNIISFSKMEGKTNFFQVK